MSYMGYTSTIAEMHDTSTVKILLSASSWSMVSTFSRSPMKSTRKSSVNARLETRFTSASIIGDKSRLAVSAMKHTNTPTATWAEEPSSTNTMRLVSSSLRKSRSATSYHQVSVWYMAKMKPAREHASRSRRWCTVSAASASSSRSLYRFHSSFGSRHHGCRLASAHCTMRCMTASRSSSAASSAASSVFTFPPRSSLRSELLALLLKRSSALSLRFSDGLAALASSASFMSWESVAVLPSLPQPPSTHVSTRSVVVVPAVPSTWCRMRCSSGVGISAYIFAPLLPFSPTQAATSGSCRTPSCVWYTFCSTAAWRR
mmetsp:Transcript_11069/g.23079  ORF Transcript_11069/g.23079 Transcript_11069/m.23079 type:complete len:316 (+) Transcript_11069:351-1298(+)